MVPCVAVDLLAIGGLLEELALEGECPIRLDQLWNLKKYI
jgi:hypothetical protein